MTQFKMVSEQVINISDEQLLELVEQRLREITPSDYMLSEGKLYSYERIGWDSYDWEEVPHNTIGPNALLLLEQRNKALSSIKFILEQA